MKEYFKETDGKLKEDRRKLFNELKNVKTVLRSPYLSSKLYKSQYHEISHWVSRNGAQKTFSLSLDGNNTNLEAIKEKQIQTEGLGEYQGDNNIKISKSARSLSSRKSYRTTGVTKVEVNEFKFDIKRKNNKVIVIKVNNYRRSSRNFWKIRWLIIWIKEATLR